MNQQPEKRPAKSDSMRKKKLATARKKKKQRQLMISAAAVILVVALVVILCVALIINKSKNPKKVDGTADNTSVTTIADKDSTKKTDVTTAKSDTATTAAQTDATTAAKTTETPTEVKEPLASKLFTYTDSGKVSGAPYNYKGLNIHIGTSTVSTASYYGKYRDYVKGWYDAMKAKATSDFTSEGEGNTWFHLVFNGTDRETRLALRVNGSRISYGAQSGMPQQADAASFSVGGVTLGDSTDTVKSAFGTPTSQNDGILNYEFENGAVLYFRLSGGKVSQIYLTLTAFSEANP